MFTRRWLIIKWCEKRRKNKENKTVKCWEVEPLKWIEEDNEGSEWVHFPKSSVQSNAQNYRSIIKEDWLHFKVDVCPNKFNSYKSADKFHENMRTDNSGKMINLVTDYI